MHNSLSHARRVRPTGVTSRVLLTALGAAGLIGGAFLKWTRDLEATHVSWRAFYQSGFGSTGLLERSVGGAAIAAGIVALLGLAGLGGWLTRLAGALGVVGVVLFIVQVQQSSDHQLQVGVWIALAGAMLCATAGLGGRRSAVVVDE